MKRPVYIVPTYEVARMRVLLYLVLSTHLTGQRRRRPHPAPGVGIA